jgi:aminoglycoside 2''-phosphotransferase
MTTPSIDWQRLTAAHPELAFRSVEALGEGWTSRSYLVDGYLVFRFPKRQEVWDELDREIAFLAAIGDLLPLAVPRYSAAVRSSVAASHGYAVYAYVPGQTLTPSSMSADERVDAAERIASFLRTLHDVQLADRTRLQLPHDDAREGALVLRRAAEERVLPQLSQAHAKRLLDRFDWYIDTETNFTFQPVVIHADLCADHVLVDNRVVGGIIDFSDVCFGDADYDFASLVLDLGTEFVVEVANRYGHSNLDRLLAKLRYFELADHVDTIVYGEGWALPGQREAAWQRLRCCLE